MTYKLSQEDWKEIKILLRNKERNISKISKDYGISRHSLYEYCWRRNWIKKEQKSMWQKFIWRKFKEWYKR